ncbi:MAG: hypothetical protein E7L01_31750 [Paenibacillus macerans]|uniref:hypothetical protein n=1 Tax=Paenibacillus TaxID=44249 RepID=UPI00242FFFBB|nr:hypothetical protein [Paenibacillus macerans]MBS5914413.1 hypothetical protein [Paenibacillus macerans]MDU7477882.1 hypothetical protein [Paenibacillus macerans]
MDTVLADVGIELERSCGCVTIELEHIATPEVKEYIGEVSERLAGQAVDLSFGVYRSVETILLGVRFISHEAAAYPVTAWMKEFSRRIGELLDLELVRISETIEQELQRYIEKKFNFPEVTVEF